MSEPWERFLSPQTAPAPKVSGVDDYLDQLDRVDQASIRSLPPPDQTARANALARQFGVPPSQADGNLPTLEQQAQIDKSVELGRQHPGYARWAADPRNAAVAADDHEAIAKTAGHLRALDRLTAPPPAQASVGGFFKGIGEAFRVSAVGALDQIRELGKLIPLPASMDSPASTSYYDAQARKRVEAAQASYSNATPQFQSKTVAGLYSGLSSLAIMAPGIAASIATKSPAAGIASAGLLQETQAYTKYRARGATTGQAVTGGVLEGGIEAAGEVLPLGVIVNRFGTTPVRKFIAEYLIKEGLSEQVTQHAQDAVDTIIANPNKTWGQYLAERPDAAYNTALATLVAGAVIGGASETSHAFVERRQAAADATEHGPALDGMMEAAAASKTRTRDPEVFHGLMSELAGNEGASHLYLPAEAVQSYMQSEGYDGSFDDFRSAVEEGVATGGDVVLPIGEAVAKLAGSKAWEALKEDARVSAGGMSRNEAKTFEDAMSDHMANITAKMDQQHKETMDRLAPVEQMASSLTEKLQNAGFTPHVAQQQAELLAQRAQTRASRMGQDIKGNEYDALAVNQVLPENLALAQKADRLDFVINAMKRGADTNTAPGKSLLEFVSDKGGVVDAGGDLQAMGAQDWHKGKAFRKRLVQDKGRTLDDLAQSAFEAGYFPGMSERPSINDLLDAMGKELGGAPQFANFASESAANADTAQAQLVQAADELRALLHESGVDPKTATPKEIRDAVSKFSEQAQGAGFDQSFSDGPRGRITFPTSGYGRGQTIIDLFQSRDQSTFLHETGHMWLEELRFDASDPNAPDQLKADWQAVQDWFSSNGHPLEDGSIPVDAHEMWARGVERYLMEGKAPVPALRKLFETFKSWLVQVYRTVGKLNAPISDDIRAVMDRLIATDNEIAQAREAQSIEAGFTDKPATMSDAEWGAYQDSVTTARDGAHDALLAKVMGAIKRRVTKEYRDQAASVREEVAGEIDGRPEFRAIKQLRETPMDQATIADIYGPDALAMLPKAVPPVYKTDGVSPSDIAELAGFTSADEMIRTLMGVEARRKEMRGAGDKRSIREALISQEVDARMLERYGDPLTDGSIEEEALAAIHSDAQGEVMATELRVLSRSTGDKPTPYSVAKAWAARTVREGTVADTTSRAAIQRYRRAAAKAGKASIEAIVARDDAEAFKQKQAQMLNNALLAEAERTARDVDAAVKRMSNWAKRKTVKSVDQDYLERAQALLEQVDMRPRSQRAIERQAQFESWANEQEALGHDIVVPASFAASIGTTHWSKLSVEQLLGLDAAVSQVIHLGRLKQTLLDGKEARDFEEIVREAEGQGDNIGRKPPSDLMAPDWRDKMKAGALSFDAALLKMETVFDWLDQGKAEGVFNRVVFKPIAEAEAREKAMLTDYYGRIRSAFEGVGKDQLKRWSEAFDAPELINKETGQPWKMRRDQLVMMALNIGNAGNVQRLTDGYGWNEQSVRDVLNRELTAQDWQFVQNVWDTIDTLWPEISALERRVNGVEPDKVDAIPVETPYGTFNGGYFPAIYDATKDYQAERNSGKASDLLEATYTRSTTRAASTKDRAAAVKRPILLNLGVINRHLGEVIHDITHREAVMNADKFLSAPRIQRTIDEVLNPEIRKQMRPWLKFVANQWASERSGNEGIGKFLQKMRANTTVVGMGFRASTILTQIAGYSNSFEVVGAKWVSAAIASTAASPIATHRFVMERSDEVRNRMDTLDRDINATLTAMAGQNKAGNALTAAKRFAFHGIGYADRMVVIPTWLGAYNKALASGAEEHEAIYAADKAVRVSQGASSAKDMAAIQRGTGKHGEFLKAMTMFYSYMSAMYQRQRTLGRDTVRAGASDVPALIARAWWLIAVPPVLSAILGGNGPGDDEDWGAWTFKQMLFNALGPIPGVRDLARPVWDAAAGNRGFDYQLSPLQRAGQSFVIAAKDLGKIAQGDETKHATRDTLEAAGYATGLVPGQIAASSQFLVDMGNGDADPKTLQDWYTGLTKGKL